ncbi:hypothetical protein [Bradyrhizobium sp. CB1650]|uniref:hypothetical protein n=1 Tax=Bradyrhizobium sp. CB1650 TaxID=3039153 RepID=UPI00325FAE23
MSAAVLQFSTRSHGLPPERGTPSRLARMDNLNKKGQADRSKINMSEDYEAKH